MNQIKIGKFIAECRKEKNLTQAQLAELMGVSDRAVSKWETGRSLPDSGIMLELTGTLGISVNELLTGERIVMENYKEIAENNLIMLKQQEETDNRLLLQMEVVIGILSTVSFLTLVTLAGLSIIESIPVKVVLISMGSILFIIGVGYCLKLEREAGYYECSSCHHTYVPEMRSIIWARHFGRTRKLTCPECGTKCWHKKVLTKGRT